MQTQSFKEEKLKSFAAKSWRVTIVMNGSLGRKILVDGLKLRICDDGLYAARCSNNEIRFRIEDVSLVTDNREIFISFP